MIRRGLRIDAELSVVDSATGRAYRATDISTSGLFLEGGQHLKKGSVQSLAVRYGQYEVSLAARVVRHSPHGAGLVLIDPSPGNLAALSELLDAALSAASDTRDERRVAPRTQDAGAVRWRFGDHTRLGALDDLSVTGASIRSAEAPEPGAIIVLTLVSRAGGPEVTCSASVLRDTEAGFAITFVEPSAEFVKVVTERLET